MTKNNHAPIHTYRTRIVVTPEHHEMLSFYARLMSRIVRCLFAMKMSGKSAITLKNEFLRRFKITARQFNACRVQVDGKVDSIRQLNAQAIKDLKERIQSTQKKVICFEKSKKKKIQLYWKKRRLACLQKKLRRLEEDYASKKTPLCFGSRKLFRKQFTGEQTHEQWHQEWDQQRNREFFTLGSKDETAGNQTCTAIVADDGSLTLRLRLPDALNENKYMTIPNVRFAYGHETIVKALEDCKLRSKLLKEKHPASKDHGQAISYRFVLDEKGWTVFASTVLSEPIWATDRNLGAVGLDINVDHLAVTETDRYGNPIATTTVPLSLYGKSQNQARAIIGDACRRVVEIAAQAKKPLVVEQLNFTKKKQNLRELRPSLARVLSSFAYSHILQTLRSRAYRSGVELFDVNPAFTSLLGRIKYASRYGISIHHAAALCIARRCQGFLEKLPLKSSVPDGKGCQIDFFVPVRNRKKNGWQHLKEVSRKLRAALVEHFRVVRSQSIDPPKTDLCDEKSSKTVGETPACESLATLLG